MYWTINVQETHFLKEYSFNNIYITGEILEEWKKQYCHNYLQERWQKLENCRGSSLLNACYKLYCKILNEKLRVQGENFLLECQSGFRKGRFCIDPLFNMKLLIEKRRKFNLETHLAFLDYVETFDIVERDKIFEVLESNSIRNLLLYYSSSSSSSNSSTCSSSNSSSCCLV